MRRLALILIFSIPAAVVAQNFQSDLPSENFFSPYCLHYASFAILPVFSYQLNSKGTLFNSRNYEDANTSDFLANLLRKGKSRNYLSFNMKAGLLDYHKKTAKGELGFGIGMKAGGIFLSKTNLPSLPANNDTAGLLQNRPDMNLKVKLNAYSAVSYSFSYLKNIHKRHLQNYGLKIELLTGLYAVKSNFKSEELQIKDTNNINLIIKRRGFVVRSNNTFLPEETLPFFKNPGLALSYGLKWQLSDKNKIALDISNFGFIYFSRTKSNLHRGIDTLNLKSESDPFSRYKDSLKSYSNDHNEAYYFLPFDINASFGHQIDTKHSLLVNLNFNPIIQRSMISVSLTKNILQFQLTPSFNLFNFNQLMSGLGLAKNSKFISWGININYLASTVNLYKDCLNNRLNSGDRNNFQSAFYIYYHLIGKARRQNSRNHKLIRTYVRN